MENNDELPPLSFSGSSAIRYQNKATLGPFETKQIYLPIGEAFQRDEIFQQWRGHIINNALFIEEKIANIISKIFFDKNRERISQFHSIILEREFFTFMNKWKVLRDILNSISPYKEKDYTQLKTDLKEIVEVRDKFAHGNVIYSGDDGKKIFLEYFSGEAKREEITEDTIKKFIELAKKCHEELNKLTSK
jgi:hypothetical protein